MELEEQVKNDPGKREAQRVLAREVTQLVHGREALNRAEKISQALFYGNLRDLTEKEVEEGFRDVPSMTVQENEISLVDLLVSSGLSSSRRQAREDIRNRAVYINDELSDDTDRILVHTDRLWGGKYTIIRRGKKKYFLVKWLV
ncbi:MAG: hypothetical protein GX244_06210 [Firmicutes bacterium]|nr:hypothetical protein [Bacillota bacterium]